MELPALAIWRAGVPAGKIIVMDREAKKGTRG
jgi:hypothetical protein